MKKALILSLLLIFSAPAHVLAQTEQVVKVDPLQGQRDSYVDCLYKAVEAHKEKFNSYRYKRRAIKHACQQEGKDLFKARAKLSKETEFMAKKREGNQYMQEVHKEAFAKISAEIKAKLAVTEAPVETPPAEGTAE